jgi:hypothetical protein
MVQKQQCILHINIKICGPTETTLLCGDQVQLSLTYVLFAVTDLLVTQTILTHWIILLLKLGFISRYCYGVV